MFDHIGIGVTDYEASKSFFLKALKPIGVGVVMEGQYGLGLGKDRKPSFWMHLDPGKKSPIHIAFTADSRKQVDEFHHKPA